MLAVTFPILTIWRRQIEIESYELFMKRANKGDPNASDNYFKKEEIRAEVFNCVAS
jgi:hypothetical protein